MTQVQERRRLGPDERREQILACAVRLFGERPYAEVSTTDIANAAGVTRTLLHHYFGTKRELYVEVVREMLLVPRLTDAVEAVGTPRARAEASIDFILDVMSTHGSTFVAVSGAEGVGDDPQISALLRGADDTAARRVLEVMGVPTSGPDAVERALIRAYGGLLKAAVREWVREGALTREQVRVLLVETLLTIMGTVIPQVDGS